MSTESYLAEVTLPSNGFFYNGEIPSGVIAVEAMGTEEEKLFAAGESASSSIIDKVFSSCVTSPVPPVDMYLGDRMQLLLSIRCVSYGEIYQYPYRCSECREKDWGTLNLARVPVKYAESPDDEKFEVTLPLQKRTVQVRLLKGSDELKVARYVKQVSSKTRSGASARATEFIYRNALRILQIDGQDIGIREAMEFIQSLKGLDSLHLRDEIDDHDIGPDLMVEPICSHCGYENGPMFMPFDKEFFRPKRRRARDNDYLGAAEAIESAE